MRRAGDGGLRRPVAADVGPTTWHLAHSSWFFETFIPTPHLPDYVPLNPTYAYLFNSYYVHAGERHCRAQRGYISHPTVAEVFRYRQHVDEPMGELLTGADAEQVERLEPLVELGLQHEQQHTRNCCSRTSSTSSR